MTNGTYKVVKPFGVQTSTEKKPVAAIWPQCAFRKDFHNDVLSDAGLIPFSFNTFAMVVLATVCPIPFSSVQRRGLGW